MSTSKHTTQLTPSSNVVMLGNAGPTVIYNDTISCCGFCCLFTFRRVHYYITTGNIEIQRGLICPTLTNIEMVNVKQINYKPGCTCCSTSAEIELVMNDSSPNVILKGIHNSRDVYHAMHSSIISQREMKTV